MGRKKGAEGKTHGSASLASRLTCALSPPPLLAVKGDSTHAHRHSALRRLFIRTSLIVKRVSYACHV